MDHARYRWRRGSNFRRSLLLIAAWNLRAASQPCQAGVDAARTHLAAQDYALGLKQVERCLAEEPFHRGAAVLHGNLLYLMGRDGEAMESLEQTIRREPEHWEARYALGRIYYFNQRPDPAAEQFEAIVSKQPENYRAWDNLGLAREAGGRIREAMEAYLRSIALTKSKNQDYDWAHANLAELLMRENENRQSFNLAVEAAQRNPQSARNFYLAGKALFRLGQVEKCPRWLEKSAELDPSYPEPWYLLGQVYRRLNREAEAEKARQRFLTLKAKAPDKKR
jgi:tetratricopeptide (TPR) repeat protein